MPDAEATLTETEQTPASVLLGDSGEEETVELLGQEGATKEEPAQTPNSTTDQPGAQTAEGHRSALKKLIDEKYGGSEDKFTEGLYSQWNSSAELAKTLKEVKQELADLKAGKASAEPTPESDPDLSSLTDQRALVVQDLEALQSQASEIIQEFNATREEIIRKETRAELADDYDKKSLLSEAAALKAQMKGLEATYKGLPREKKRLEVQLTLLDNQMKAAKGAVQTRAKAQEEQKAQEAEFRTEWQSTLHTLIDQAAKEKSIPEGSKTHQRMGEYIWNSIYAYLAAQPADAPGINPIEAVAYYANAFHEGLAEGQKQQFQAASRTKASASTPSAIKQAAGPVAKVKARELTQEQIKAHHKAVFG